MAKTINAPTRGTQKKAAVSAQLGRAATASERSVAGKPPSNRSLAESWDQPGRPVRGSGPGMECARHGCKDNISTTCRNHKPCHASSTLYIY